MVVCETGLKVQVPLFVNVGDVIRVDTSEGQYQTRYSPGDAPSACSQHRRRPESGAPHDCLRQCSSGMAEPRITLPHWPVSVVSTSCTAQHAGGLPVEQFETSSGTPAADWDFVVAASGSHSCQSRGGSAGRGLLSSRSRKADGTRHRYRPSFGAPGHLDFASLRAANSIIEDLQTRDFTINAMAVSLEGDLIDPVGGATDVSLRQLRMVAPDCFTADSVRLIRAVRLSAQFGMTITEETRSRIVAEAPAIATAAERVRAELVALLALTTASEGLRLLIDLGIVQHMVPELVTPTPSGPVVDKTSLAAVEVLATLDAYLANNGHEDRLLQPH